MSLEQEHTELSKKIQAGLKLAFQRLYERRAANNQTVVISVNGEIKHVPAKDLLNSFHKD